MMPCSMWPFLRAPRQKALGSVRDKIGIADKFLSRDPRLFYGAIRQDRISHP